MKSKFTGPLLRVMMSLGAIGIMVWALRHKLSDAWFILRHDVSWPFFFLAGAMYFMGLVFMAFRLQSVFSVQGIHLDFKQTFYLGFIGLFFNLFLPSAVGGDIAKAYYAYKYSGKKMASTTSILLDRVLGFMALIFMAFLAVLLNRNLENPAINRMVCIAMGCMLFAIIFFMSRRFARLFGALKEMIPSSKWRERFTSIYQALYSYKKHRKVLLYCVFISLAGQAFFIPVHYWLAVSLGVRLNILIFFLLVPVVSIASMAPSLGGLGVREASMVLLFQRFMPGERALALSVLLDMLIYGFSLISGILFSFQGGLKMKAIEAMEEIK